MYSDGTFFYPTRAFIRFQAKKQLITELYSSNPSTSAFRFGESNMTAIIDAQSDGSSDRIPAERQPHDPQVDERFQPDSFIDDELLAEIASTAFHPEQHPELYQPHASKEMVTDMEGAIAAEIVDTYKHILKNRSDQFIQGLNSLL